MSKSARAAQLVMICGAVVVSVLGIALRSTTNATDAWGKYTGKDEEFTVRMPRKPWVYYNLITNRSGKQTAETIYSAYSTGVVYLVVSYDRHSLEDTFENFRLHHCTQGQITSTKEKTLAGFAGKEYSLKFREVFGTVDVYVTKKRGYAVAIVQATDNPSLRDYFLSTFSLSGTDAPVTIAPETKSLPLSDWPHIAKSDKEVTRPPFVVSKPEPVYTEEARNAGVTGTVVLDVILWQGGDVGNILVKRGLPKGLTEQATEAAKHLTFIPATRDGAFVSYMVELQYNFNLY